MSVPERRAVVEHTASVPTTELLRALNAKQLGASLEESQAGAGGGNEADSRFGWFGIAMRESFGVVDAREVRRAAYASGQVGLFLLALVLQTGLPELPLL